MNESTDHVATNAVGGKTARPCDSCVRRRARWYCAADDAFLCQPCDADVHSANPLARRHVRVRLKTASAVLKPDEDNGPAWHRGFRRKARTPRPLRPAAGTMKLPSSPPLPVRSGPIVPDLEGSWDDTSSPVEDEEEHLLYLVPIFDPVLAEFCSPPADTKPQLPMPECPQAATPAADCLVGFHPTDVELAEFDVESLLGHGLEDDAFCMEGLGLADGGDMGESLAGGCFVGDERVKAEVDADVMFHADVEMETLDINFDYESPTMDERAGDASGERRFDLRLDYDGVIAAWSGQGCSPWSGGERPHLNLDDCWPEYTGMWGGEVQGAYGGEVGTGGHVADCGREARVLRYREKRRTRLFSKKIRYEVRKLNAEKRPRMKGRFVKRAATSFPNTTPTQPGFRF